ncbi:hypothetical protein [Paraburkholderia heleia]|uniref:hypothetical protein n=1 Tax=Paraburkholderia heleia TaxID=634127 RepID=UPI002AB61F43|nr:hypothetical protein [Paraburkholderia heleia]
MKDTKLKALPCGTPGDIRNLAARVLVASALNVTALPGGARALGVGLLPTLAARLLDEAVQRGFSEDVQLRALMAAGEISARTVELLGQALMHIPEDVIADIVMKLRNPV